MKANKEIRKKLRQAAGILHRDFPRTYEALHKRLVPKNPQLPWLPDMVWIEVPQKHPVNHYLRMKRAFKRGGFPAVNEYMAKVTGRKK